MLQVECYVIVGDFTTFIDKNSKKTVIQISPPTGTGLQAT